MAVAGAAHSSLVLGVAVAALLLLLVSCGNAQQGDCRGQQELIARCQQYVMRFGPKKPPSQDCCTAVQAADLPCLCNRLTPPIAALIDISKVCYVASTCGVKMPPPGSKCGSAVVPANC